MKLELNITSIFFKNFNYKKNDQPALVIHYKNCDSPINFLRCWLFLYKSPYLYVRRLGKILCSQEQ